jgi:hypothetical protein
MSKMSHLERLIANRCHVDEAELDELSDVDVQKVFELMAAAGYEIGKDELSRNQWWPANKTV